MRWSGCPVHQLSTHGSRCRKCGGAPHGWCGSSSCEEDRNPQPTFLGLNLNLKMVWRAVKLATGRFHFFHRSSGSLGNPGVLGVPESWESRESRSLGNLGSPGVSNCKLYLCQDKSLATLGQLFEGFEQKVQLEKLCKRSPNLFRLFTFGLKYF